MTPIETSPPAPPPPAGDLSHGSNGIAETLACAPARRWQVGTLTYTAGGLTVLFFWLLCGDFAISLRDRSAGPVAQLMLIGFGASNLTMSVLLSVIPTTISMVLTPIISYRSDRARSKWGRRIPYLLIPTPFAAIAMIGLAYCRQAGAGLHYLTGDLVGEHTASLIAFGFFWTLYELAAVSAIAVFGGLINDVVPRPVIGRFFGMFRAISLIDGMIFNWFILGHAEAHFTIIFVWIALVFGVGFSLMCFRVKEGAYPEPPPADSSAPAGGLFQAISIYFRECFGSAHYRWTFAALTLATLAAIPINSWMMVYAKSLGLGMGSWDDAGIGWGSYRLGYGGIMTVSFIFSLCLAYPMGALVDRFHAIRITVVSMFLYAVSCIAGTFLIHDARSFGWAMCMHTIFSGIFFTASASLNQALLPRAKFSQFASAGGLVTQFCILALGPLLGQILDLLHSDYRIVFFISGIFAMIAGLLLVRVFYRLKAVGGLDRSVALAMDQAAADGAQNGSHH